MANARDTFGASLAAVTFNMKVSDALAVPSDAVTVRLSSPLKLSGGVPENVRVAGSNIRDGGSGEPSPNVAV